METEIWPISECYRKIKMSETIPIPQDVLDYEKYLKKLKKETLKIVKEELEEEKALEKPLEAYDTDSESIREYNKEIEEWLKTKEKIRQRKIDQKRSIRAYKTINYCKQEEDRWRTKKMEDVSN